MRRIDALARRAPEARSGSFTLSDYLNLVKFTTGGNTYALPTTTYGTDKGEPIPNSFDGYVRHAYQSNGPVFSASLARLQVFSQARFQFVTYQNGRRGDFFGTPALSVLERPWAGGSTADLLARMEQRVTTAGNFYATLHRGQVKVLRPDWVTILRGSVDDHDDENEITSELVGYHYWPGGPRKAKRPTLILPEDMCHYAPIPDPLATWRGMSWITPVLREIEGDDAATDHKAKFFQQGATPNMVVTLDKAIAAEEFARFRELMEQESAGLDNAYKTLYLGGGADAQVVGQSFEQMSFKATQGAGESRIASAAGVPPVLAGFSEGLQAATYSNYAQARRRFVDMTIEHLWEAADTSVAQLVAAPAGAYVRHDTRDMPFLREDQKDAAEIQGLDARSIDTFVRAGFEPDSAVAAVVAGDLSLLVHGGGIPTTLYDPTALENPNAQTNGNSAAGATQGGGA